LEEGEGDVALETGFEFDFDVEVEAELEADGLGVRQAREDRGLGEAARGGEGLVVVAVAAAARGAGAYGGGSVRGRVVELAAKVSEKLVLVLRRRHAADGTGTGTPGEVGGEGRGNLWHGRVGGHVVGLFLVDGDISDGLDDRVRRLGDEDGGTPLAVEALLDEAERARFRGGEDAAGLLLGGGRGRILLLLLGGRRSGCFVLGEVERLDVYREDARPEGGGFAVLAAVDGELVRKRWEGSRSGAVR